MAVQIDYILPWTQLVATSGQTVFSTNWTADDDTDVKVYARGANEDADDETQLVDPADYTITFVGDGETVEVTFDTGRTAGDIITIFRATPADRMNLFINTNFEPSMLNGEIGRLVMMLQQSDFYDLDLSPRYNISETLQLDGSGKRTIDIILPILPANCVWMKNADDDQIIAVALGDFDALGLLDVDYVIGTPNPLLPNAQVLGALGTGLMVNIDGGASGTLVAREIEGVDDEIDVTDGDGAAGNPTIGLADNVILPGTEGFTWVAGTTAERPGAPNEGQTRWNTDTNVWEGWDGASWVDFLSGTAGATRELDNLQNVAINTSLLPDADSAHDLGSNLLWWATAYIDTLADGVRATTQAPGDNSTLVATTEFVHNEIEEVEVYFRATMSGDQTLANITNTLIQFDTENVDSDGWYDPTTYRFTPQRAGWYLIRCVLLFDPAASGSCQARIMKNGTLLDFVFISLDPGSVRSASVEDLIEFNGTTDYIEIQGYQNSGGNLNVDLRSIFVGIYIGP